MLGLPLNAFTPCGFLTPLDPLRFERACVIRRLHARRARRARVAREDVYFIDWFLGSLVSWLVVSLVSYIS